MVGPLLSANVSSICIIFHEYISTDLNMYTELVCVDSIQFELT